MWSCVLRALSPAPGGKPWGVLQENLARPFDSENNLVPQIVANGPPQSRS